MGVVHLRVKFISAAVLAAGLAGLLIIWNGEFSARPVPAVSLTTIEGIPLRLDAMNDRVVLVNFWATTCATCIREMPKLAELYEKYQQQGYRTVAVAMPYDPPNRVINYVKRYPVPFDVALDIEGKVLRAFGDVPGTPTSFLVNKHGIVIRKYLGAPDFADLERRIRAAIAQP